MRILNLSEFPNIMKKVLERAENIEGVDLSAGDRRTFNNVLKFMSVGEASGEDFAISADRLIKKYDCDGCVLDRGLTNQIGLVEDCLHKAGRAVCYPLTVTTESLIRSNDGFKTEYTTRYLGISVKLPDGKVQQIRI